MLARPEVAREGPLLHITLVLQPQRPLPPRLPHPPASVLCTENTDGSLWTGNVKPRPLSACCHTEHPCQWSGMAWEGRSGRVGRKAPPARLEEGLCGTTTHTCHGAEASSPGTLEQLESGASRRVSGDNPPSLSKHRVPLQMQEGLASPPYLEPLAVTALRDRLVWM